MQKFGFSAVGVLQGSVQMFSAFEDNGIMWTGHGPRRETRRIDFSEPFQTVPVIHVSISMWDIESSANQRADIATQNITAEGFDIVFRTWGDTRVARIRADWLAIGAVRHDDDFDL
ncbi:H-type lectin domain-containing protein [Paracoccus onubensis]|uniref:H-type lectin domain-containing protein n=1 Tax=Paracoccus onubensis TaxID=1675788 RepID=UPI002731DA16|nr:H-type lectin domain-containing protein [Paracoccus onubensis]MDP0928785.1 H-type lectin domain-containing protein [Paracoccus onubensis]